jgi:hypothetical protein
MEVDYVRVYQESPSSTSQTDKDTEPKYYPNPVHDQLTINLGDVTQPNVHLEIYTLEGELIRSYTRPVNNQLITVDNLGALPAGMYIIAYTLEGRRFNIKIIKE